MPAAANPHLAEFFVYRLEAGKTPFYVGIGRAARASDRIRFVRYLMRREKRALPPRWCLSTKEIAGLIRAGIEPRVTYRLKNVCRADALTFEKTEINRLNARGLVLANIKHNPRQPISASQVVQSVLSRMQHQHARKNQR